uniref:Uncharacterized protein n=1 Tax=Schistosoma curassoni TaxID=6186 RepID=A0A183JR92_9TREM
MVLFVKPLCMLKYILKNTSCNSIKSLCKNKTKLANSYASISILTYRIISYWSTYKEVHRIIIDSTIINRLRTLYEINCIILSWTVETTMEKSTVIFGVSNASVVTTKLAPIGGGVLSGKRPVLNLILILKFFSSSAGSDETSI